MMTTKAMIPHYGGSRAVAVQPSSSDLVFYEHNLDRLLGRRRNTLYDLPDYGSAILGDLVSLTSSTRSNRHFVFGSVNMPTAFGTAADDLAGMLHGSVMAALPPATLIALDEMNDRIEELASVVKGIRNRLDHNLGDTLTPDPIGISTALASLSETNSHLEDWAALLERAADIEDKPDTFFAAARIGLHSPNPRVRAAAAELIGFSDEQNDLEAVQVALAKETDRFVRLVLASAERAISL